MANQEKSAAELYREERKKRIAKAAKSNSRKHITYSRQLPNVGKAQHLYGDLGYFKRQAFKDVYISHTFSRRHYIFLKLLDLLY